MSIKYKTGSQQRENMTAEDVQVAQYILCNLYEEERSTSLAENTYSHSVWFFAKNGWWLHNDERVKHVVVMDLLDRDLIRFQSMEMHQGEMMLRYRLTDRLYCKQPHWKLPNYYNDWQRQVLTAVIQ